MKTYQGQCFCGAVQLEVVRQRARQTLHRRLDEYIAAGLTKFVVRPLTASGTADFVDRFARELLPRQN